MTEFKNLRATIVGLAREGTVAARFLCERGATVTISDSSSPTRLAPALRQIADLPVHIVFGANREHDLTDTDLLVLSPGVPLTVPAVAAAFKAGVPVTSEPKLFLERCAAPVIGVTGSSGKTTTTALIKEMIRAAGRTVHLGGNIGSPLLGRLADIQPNDIVAMELSSFQLQLLDISPRVAVVTTLTPDHLDRHATIEEYFDAKARIVRFQKPDDIAILNADSSDVGAFSTQAGGKVRWFSLIGPVIAGAYLEDDTLWLAGDNPRPILTASEILLPGRHNIANALAAAAAVDALGIPVEAMAEACRTFAGVKNRIETVAESNGVRYVNDSIATSPDRAIAALHTFDAPLRWLVGGRGKNLPLGELPNVAAQRVLRAYPFGEAGQEIAVALRAVGCPIAGPFSTMAEAVHSAATDSHSGDIVLLSPACTSFDEFRDYEERGRVFRELVGEHTMSEAVR